MLGNRHWDAQFFLELHVCGGGSGPKHEGKAAEDSLMHTLLCSSERTTCFAFSIFDFLVLVCRSFFTQLQWFVQRTTCLASMASMFQK
jgi:hypothetical protein